MKEEHKKRTPEEAVVIAAKSALAEIKPSSPLPKHMVEDEYPTYGPLLAAMKFDHDRPYNAADFYIRTETKTIQESEFFDYFDLSTKEFMKIFSTLSHYHLLNFQRLINLMSLNVRLIDLNYSLYDEPNELYMISVEVDSKQARKFRTIEIICPIGLFSIIEDYQISKIALDFSAFDLIAFAIGQNEQK